LALRTAYRDAVEGRGTVEALEAAGDALFAKEQDVRRLACLKTNAAVRSSKLALLDMLRSEDIILLEKGAIEDYYPNGLGGTDKPTKALRFCESLQSKDDVLRFCDAVPSQGEVRPEFIAAFERVFASIPKRETNMPTV
jgi:hypothetical protein